MAFVPKCFNPLQDIIQFSLSYGLTRAEQHMAFQPRSVSVMIHGLIVEGEFMTNLFAASPDAASGMSESASRMKWEKVRDLMDNMRVKFDPHALSLGPPGEVPGGYLGAKIAFGRTPDEVDFSGAPMADSNTHFVTV